MVTMQIYYPAAVSNIVRHIDTSVAESCDSIAKSLLDDVEKTMVARARVCQAEPFTHLPGLLKVQGETWIAAVQDTTSSRAAQEIYILYNVVKTFLSQASHWVSPSLDLMSVKPFSNEVKEPSVSSYKATLVLSEVWASHNLDKDSALAIIGSTVGNIIAGIAYTRELGNTEVSREVVLDQDSCSKGLVRSYKALKNLLRPIRPPQKPLNGKKMTLRA